MARYKQREASERKLAIRLQHWHPPASKAETILRAIRWIERNQQPKIGGHADDGDGKIEGLGQGRNGPVELIIKVVVVVVVVAASDHLS